MRPIDRIRSPRDWNGAADSDFTFRSIRSFVTGYVRHKDFRNLESVYGNVDVVHIATQGLLGLSAMRYATRYRKACVGFYHTNWPAYVNEYLPSLIPSRLKSTCELSHVGGIE